MNKIILFLTACLCFCSCNEDYYINKANRYCELGEFEKAIECYDKVLELNPDNYDMYIDKAITYSDMKKEEEAVKIYSEAIKRFPERAYAYNCRAESYMRLKEYEKALEDYNSTLKIIVGNGNELFRLAGGVYNEFFHINNPDDNIDPYTVYADRAVAYYYLDSIKPAWIDLNYCISRSKELGQCYYWRAYVYFRVNDIRAACDDLKKSASLGYTQASLDYKKNCDCDNN